MSEAPRPETGPYDMPQVYDVAFGYRAFAAEVDMLTAWWRRIRGAAEGPRSVLELACGPAEHALELASRGARAAAIDLSPAMCAYARQRAAARAVPLDVHRADMCDFRIAQRFDLALLMIASASHLPTLDAFVRNLRTVAAHLERGGCYVLEMTHPRDFLGPQTHTRSNWTCKRDGLEVETRWGSEDDPYDPITQTVVTSVEYRVRRVGAPGVERRFERVSIRDWTATEVEAAVRISGVFEVAERHGEWALDAPFDATPGSWRMIIVLRKIDA